MFIIADSGSTKTRWELVQNGKTASIYTSGINPFYKNTEQITADLRNELLPQMSDQPVKVFFYGAGISQTDKAETVRGALNEIFPKAKVEVEHDLLAAARATCGSAPGIACILGTGSNSCLYDGKNITDNIPSLGFMLGDEGSGGHFGRKILQAYYYREMPDDLRKMLEAKYDMKKDHVLNAIYGSTIPNQVSASYSSFIADANQHPFIRELLQNGFREFLERHVCKYEGYQNLHIHFIGSVAFFNQKILIEVLDDMKLKKGVIIKSPMEGLIKFHVAEV